jgi:hypothetical protein
MENSYDDFRTCGKQMVDYICDYIKTMDERPVAPTAIEPGFLSKELDLEAPQEPESFNKTMDDFEKKIMKGETVFCKCFFLNAFFEQAKKIISLSNKYFLISS